MFLSYELAGSQADFLKKNIWTSFCVLLLAGAVILYFVSALTWENIYQDAVEKHRHAITLVSTSTKSSLNAQENQLDLIGIHLLDDDNYKDTQKSRAIMAQLMDNNPALAGFGLTNTTGEFLITSDMKNLSMLPNLRTYPQTADSFALTLNTHKMTLGRSYYMPALEEWVLPIRKSLRDDGGEIVAVMTAGLKITGANSFIEGSGMNADEDILFLVREADLYPQYVSANYLLRRPNVYDMPISRKVYENALEMLATQGFDKADLMHSSGIYDFELNNRFDEAQIMSLKYLPEFSLWVVSQKPKSAIYSEFFNIFWVYLLAFFFFMATIYWLFRRLLNTEKQRLNELEFKSFHDDLTSLPNLTKLKMLSLKNWNEDGAACAVFYVDLDNFKSANDAYGNAFGDEVLVEMAHRLRTFCPDTDCVFHTSGDEFVIRKPDNGTQSMTQMAEELLAELSRPYARNEASILLTASIGVARYPDQGANLSETIKAAQIAMFEAKKQKNQFLVYDEAIYQLYHEKLTIEQELKQAIGSEQFVMFYQPQVSADGSLSGLEALVRWENPALGFVPPDKFIRVAESSGLMPRLGRHLMSLIFADAKQINDKLSSSIDLAINISATQFMQEDFVEQFNDLSRLTSTDNIQYVLELTENVFVEDLDLIRPKIDQLRESGTIISLDDFGTGFSSLSLLRQLPIDELKIDKSFVDSLIHDVTARKMVRNIISIGEILELKVIAEGVETQQHVDILQDMDCHRFQGYFFSKPMPLSPLLAKISELDSQQPQQ